MKFTRLDEEQKAELWATLALRHCQGLGALRVKRLLLSYGSALASVQAARKKTLAWMEKGLVSDVICRRFSTEEWREKAKKEWDAIQHSACSFILWNSANYPALLKETVDAPILLYYSGDVSLLSSPAVGIVGSRRCSREGIRMAAFLGRGLSMAGITVISGMAKGIDRAAHIAGLEGPGRSIAVLGTGVDVVYPQCNHDLAGALGTRGLLVSEFMPGTQPHPKHFPVRNRIISGLSRGVLVVEAANRSGSLITARQALEQGREVFAIPGAGSSSNSEGCRDLIRRGAKPVFNADDILVELAPLLTHDARVALENRQKNPVEDTAQAVSQALEVLPTGQIPWLAPDEQTSAKATTVAQDTVKGAGSVRPSGMKLKNTPGQGTEKSGNSLASGAGTTDSAGGGPEGEGLDCPAYNQAGTDVAALPYVLADPQGPEGSKEQATFDHAQLQRPDLGLLGAEEQLVVQHLGENPRHIDELVQATGFEVAKLSGLLTMLEITGVVVRRPGMFYLLG